MPTRAGSQRGRRSAGWSWAGSSASSFRGSPRKRCRTRSPISSRWCRSRRAACGRGVRFAGRRTAGGSEPTLTHRLSWTRWCCATSAPSGRPRSDVRVWSGLPALREVVDRLAPAADLHRRQRSELFDLPDARGPLRHSAPVRFLPEYDNVLFSHDDRSRVIPDGRSVPLPPGDGARRSVLVDGDFRATWRVSIRDDTAALTVRGTPRLARHEVDDVREEGDGCSLSSPLTRQQRIWSSRPDRPPDRQGGQQRRRFGPDSGS